MTSRDRRAALAVGLLLGFVMAMVARPHPALADLMIIGNDEKVVFDAEGNRSVAAPGKDTISVVDGTLAVLKIEGKKVTKVGEVEVGGLPEGLVFSPDGKYLYVGNYTDRDVSILKVDGAKITDTGKKLKLPGQPASMRGRAQ